MSRILLVEPDRQLARTTSQFLGKNGFDVLVAHDAQQGITIADHAEVSLVVLEIAMPKHNGVTFLQELRSYEDWRDLPVVVYSQIAREDTGVAEVDWHKLGVAAYLYKPTHTLASLLNNIQGILNNYEKA